MYRDLCSMDAHARVASTGGASFGRRSADLRGFTLVELLVVVGIISLLIGIMLPALSGAAEQARQVVCASNQRQIITGCWSYITDNQGRVPYLESPMHNNAFGNAAMTDAQVDPFDAELWPRSMPHVLGTYMEDSVKVYSCPDALLGWPREGQGRGDWKMTYRPASANQPNGVVAVPGGYFREAFGILDGRRHEPLDIQPTDDPIQAATNHAKTRATALRDLLQRDPATGKLTGPHDRGMNVINRDFELEFRGYESLNEDLAPNGTGAQF